MRTKKVSLAELKKTLEADLRTLQNRVKRSAVDASDFGRIAAYGRAPVAFGELRDGLVSYETDKGAKIVSTAPHSAAVELGSRPHWPPLEPILEWVRLRGAQGLDSSASGGTPQGHPKRVATALAAQGNGTSTPVDAALKVANAIRAGIAAHGTPPTHFMESTVPDVVKLLDSFVKSRFAEPL